ncbi:MAG: hypothetical protein M1834_002481 [Cirrosporium novae-zelandiae]|nr:MAG: hypothetical protein M1834_002481 [Cirrosporium novae-zelandiae]
MLRLQPTIITLTQQDIQNYDESRKENKSNRNIQTASSNNDTAATKSSDSEATMDPNDELRPLPGERDIGMVFPFQVAQIQASLDGHKYAGSAMVSGQTLRYWGRD